MAIQLFFSNQLDLLAEKYAAISKAAFAAGADLFQTPLTLIPNANLGKWLQLDLARRHGVCFNSNFAFLEEGLWRMLADMVPADMQPQHRDSARLQLLVLRVLTELSAASGDCAPLWTYISGGQSPPAAGQAARLWQLSEKLAQLFSEYEFHREEMIESWRRGPLAADPQERAQQRVYRRLLELQAQRGAQDGPPLASLNAFARQVFAAAEGRISQEPLPWVHCFGLSQISAFHIGLLGRLAPFYDILIYALNPSREFWEDTLTPKETRWIVRRQVAGLRISPEENRQGELACAESHPLLALWGKPGREHIRLLCGLTDYDFEACHGEPEPRESVLKAIQHSVLSLRPTLAAGERLDQDRSLQVAACPGIFREVATVYHSILFNLERNPELALTDIAVLVPDMPRYKPVVDYIFTHAPRALVYNLVDSRAATESHYAQGVLAILELVGGRFGRRQVFQLLLNPCVMARHGYSADDLAVWVQWAENLNIFHTYDPSHKVRRGYSDSLRYTWLQGLRRLRLSRVMASSAQTGDPDAHFQELDPYGDLNSADDELLARFGLLVELVHDSLEQLSAPPTNGGGWRERLTRVLDRLLAVPEQHPGEAGVRRRIMEALATLTLYDHPGAGRETPGPSRPSAISGEELLSWELLAEFLRSSLMGIPGGVGEYLTAGVTVSALLPMRPIPFKVVYVLGMEEGGFPGRESQFALDLRRRRRRIGDISLPERNCYLFLELLMAVRQKLYISYTAKDLVKDRQLQPCAVVQQLLRFAEEHILKAGCGFQQAEVPLKGESAAYLAENARTAWSDVVVNYRPAERMASYLRTGADIGALGRTAPTSTATLPGGPMQWPPAEGSAEGKFPFPPEGIALGVLRRFLIQPAGVKVAWHLGLSEGEIGVELRALASDEPFFSAFPHTYRLELTALERWLEGELEARSAGGHDGSGLAWVTRQVYAQMQRRGDLPEGGYAILDARRRMEALAVQEEHLRSLIPEMASAARLYRRILMGDGDNSRDPRADSPLKESRFPAAALELDATGDHTGKMRPIRLHGELPWAWRTREGTWNTLVLTGRRRLPGKYPDKHVIGAVLFALAALCATPAAPFPDPLELRVHGLYGEGLQSWRYRLSRGRAHSYLIGLLQALGQGEQVEWLPVEAVTGKAKGPFFEALETGADPLVAEAFGVKLQESLEEAQLSDLLGLAAPQVPPDALEMAITRLGIFFQTL